MEVIHLRPVGDVADSVIENLIGGLAGKLGRPVARLEPVPIPLQGYDLARRQYLSTELLRAVLAGAPAGSSKVLGVAEVDLFVPVFTYVFGEAQLAGRAALMSVFRLRPTYAEEALKDSLFRMRVLKEATHELGHAFGLVHCSEARCVMSFANNVIQVDDKGSDFCPSCADIVRRSS